MDFPLPEIGEGVYEAELVRWLVKPGDPVKRGQNLLEVMTDKATLEVPSPFVGTVTALKAEPGQTVKVGHVLLNYQGDDGRAGALRRHRHPVEGRAGPDGQGRPGPPQLRRGRPAGGGRRAGHVV